MRLESTITSPEAQSTSVGTTAPSHPPALVEVLPLWCATSAPPKLSHPSMRSRT